MKVIRFPSERTKAAKEELQRLRLQPFKSMDDLPPMASWARELLRKMLRL